MQAYDIVILVLLVITTIWGAKRGFAKQLATILSLVLGYFVAVTFREPVSQMIDAPHPWNRFAAMLGLFMVTSLVVWIGFRFVKGSIEDSGLKGFDAQMGGLLGLAKGVLLAMALTMFAAVMLGDSLRHSVLESFSGYNICRMLNKAHAIVPTEWQMAMGPYLEVIEEHQQHLAGQNPASHDGHLHPPAVETYGNDPNQQTPNYNTQPVSGWSSGTFGGGQANRYESLPQQPAQQQQFGQQPEGQGGGFVQQIQQGVQRQYQQARQQVQQQVQQRVQQEVQQRVDQFVQPVQEAVGEFNRFQTPPPQQNQTQQNYYRTQQ